MSENITISSLAAVFRAKLIPWAKHDLKQRLIVAQSQMRKNDMPFGVDLVYSKIPGKRVLVRTREDGAQKTVRARWPKAGLHEVYTPRLICVLKGQTNFRAGNYIITCDEGHFILLPPLIPNTTGGQSHLEGANRKYGSCDLLQLILMHNYVNCTACSSRGEKHQGGERYTISRPRIVDCLRLFFEEAQHPQIGSEMLLSPVLTTALTLIWREIEMGRYERRRQLASKSTFRNDSVQQLREYIISHLHQSPTIEIVAQAMYMSPSGLTRFVRQQTGQSFGEILAEIRLAESKRLLQETSWSIAAIAYDIGLKSDTYFMKFFKKHTGQSPTEYRYSKNDVKR